VTALLRDASELAEQLLALDQDAERAFRDNLPADEAEAGE
jgi:hypothetical protein